MAGVHQDQRGGPLGPSIVAEMKHNGCMAVCSPERAYIVDHVALANPLALDIASAPHQAHLDAQWVEP